MLPGYAAQRGRVQLAPDQQHVQKAKPQLVILLNLFERKTKPYQAILNKPIRSRLGEVFLCEIRKSERGVVTPYTSFQGITLRSRALHFIPGHEYETGNTCGARPVPWSGVRFEFSRINIIIFTTNYI